MKTVEKKTVVLIPIRGQKEVKQVVSVRLKPSEVKYWKNMSEKLGIKDFTAFIRGAVNSAIYTSRRAEDTKWKKFVEAVQPAAKKILGHGFFDGGADLFEASGAESSGVPAKVFLAKMKKKHGKVQD